MQLQSIQNKIMMKIEYNNLYTHFLVSRDPALSDEKLAIIIADSSEKFITENKPGKGKFAWQQSVSAFSVLKSQVDAICKYILNQPEHHKKVSFEEEYQAFIKNYQATIKYPANK